MNIETIALLFGAGLISGIMNSLAGGGSLVSFPALLAAGVPPVSASATNSFSVTPGYIAGCVALRKDIACNKIYLVAIIPIAMIGGWIGSGILLSIPDNVFIDIVPWLLVVALSIFAAGPYISKYLNKHQIMEFNKNWQSLLRWQSIIGLSVLLLICSYGGFFNAGMGIMVLAGLTLLGIGRVNSMNGIKLIVSSVVSITAITRFVSESAISYHEGFIVMAGTIIGGYSAAILSRYIPEKVMRLVVLNIGIVITVVFFIGR